jgi:hypothetical protein
MMDIRFVTFRFDPLKQIQSNAILLAMEPSSMVALYQPGGAFARGTPAPTFFVLPLARAIAGMSMDRSSIRRNRRNSGCLCPASIRIMEDPPGVPVCQSNKVLRDFSNPIRTRNNSRLTTLQILEIRRGGKTCQPPRRKAGSEVAQSEGCSPERARKPPKRWK